MEPCLVLNFLGEIVSLQQGPQTVTNPRTLPLLSGAFANSQLQALG